MGKKQREGGRGLKKEGRKIITGGVGGEGKENKEEKEGGGQEMRRQRMDGSGGKAGGGL